MTTIRTIAAMLTVALTVLSGCSGGGGDHQAQVSFNDDGGWRVEISDAAQLLRQPDGLVHASLGGKVVIRVVAVSDAARELEARGCSKRFELYHNGQRVYPDVFGRYVMDHSGRYTAVVSIDGVFRPFQVIATLKFEV